MSSVTLQRAAIIVDAALKKGPRDELRPAHGRRSRHRPNAVWLRLSQAGAH